jgi:hypothetical protein
VFSATETGPSDVAVSSWANTGNEQQQASKVSVSSRITLCLPWATEAEFRSYSFSLNRFLMNDHFRQMTISSFLHMKFVLALAF